MLWALVTMTFKIKCLLHSFPRSQSTAGSWAQPANSNVVKRKPKPVNLGYSCCHFSAPTGTEVPNHHKQHPASAGWVTVSSQVVSVSRDLLNSLSCAGEPAALPALIVPGINSWKLIVARGWRWDLRGVCGHKRESVLLGRRGRSNLRSNCFFRPNCFWLYSAKTTIHSGGHAGFLRD